MLQLANDQGKINFIIPVIVKYSDLMSGGVIVMHKLAYLLAERGHNVYILTEPENPHPNIKIIKSKITAEDGFKRSYQWEEITFPYYNTVTIYSQIDGGNPIGTAHVARWILYDTELPIENSFGENDVYFNFGSFKTYRNQPHRSLTLYEYNTHKLYVTNTGKRKGFCHMIHKHTPPTDNLLINQLSSFNLTEWKELGGYDYLREKLNEYEYMLTYDQKSFYCVAAGLCGCKSIILNPGPSYEFSRNAYADSAEYLEGLTPEKYRELNPIQKYGVAYGLDDIHWANTTIHMVKDHVKQLEINDMATVDAFVKYWENKIFEK